MSQLRKSARSRPSPTFAPAGPVTDNVLTIAVGASAFRYVLGEIPNEIDAAGRGFELHKLDAESPDNYHVRVLADGTAECCSRGFQAHGHRGPCKHIVAVLGLIAAGQLPRRCICGCVSEDGHNHPLCLVVHHVDYAAWADAVDAASPVVEHADGDLFSAASGALLGRVAPDEPLADAAALPRPDAA